MKEARIWIFSLGVLIIMGWMAYTVVSAVQGISGRVDGMADSVQDVAESVQSTTEDALKPVADMTGTLATQVTQFLNPTPTVLPNPETIIREVRTLARLETIQYTIEKVVTADRGQGALEFFLGDELIFVAHGIVLAGVDLAQITADSMRLENGVLYVQLPEAEIFVATLDNEKSYVYDREKGLFTKGDDYLETAARQAAEDQIKLAALEDNILEQAKINAEQFLYRFLVTAGYPDVVFVSE
ncbi:MAG: DUF4230 domain-containing protein [Chloroflexi bacterium]|nr:DUF4230 domain-containing protein [Chloroflexota bacterium]